ncbi:hypothetical protein [Actinobacillus equuli]|uniref:hypothetical protein n=1 Tax=Actinobacillus equuli TaxID=718 RepID=UPI002442421A|nr:hypothetical protein [Actinobacillus equuli]WGE80970.1 hypothetical protein NYR66_08530 [Actinobacillus equuli subsp. haemolyticus]WGE85162.1 hypothetical protein NYR87_08560 [Actinobacillus equuli subsp. haemolyticus]
MKYFLKQKRLITPEKNFTREYNLVYISLSLLIVFSTLFGAITFYFYLQQIDSLSLLSFDSNNQFISIFIVLLIVFLFIWILFFYPFVMKDSLYRKIKTNKHIKQRNKITRSAIRWNAFLFFIFIFVLSYFLTFIDLKNLNKQYISCTIIVGSFLIISIVFLFYSSYYFYLKLRFFLKENKLNSFIGYIGFSLALFGLSDFILITCSFILGFAGINNVNNIIDLILFFIYPTIIVIIFLTIAIRDESNTTTHRVKNSLTLTLLTVSTLFIPGIFIETSFSSNIIKLIGRSDSKNVPYIIKNIEQYDINHYFIFKNITCGKQLLNSGKTIVFLPSYETDKKKILK